MAIIVRHRVTDIISRHRNLLIITEAIMAVNTTEIARRHQINRHLTTGGAHHPLTEVAAKKQKQILFLESAFDVFWYIG